MPLIKDSIMPELLELLNDENTSVKLQAFTSMVDLIPVLPPQVKQDVVSVIAHRGEMGDRYTSTSTLADDAVAVSVTGENCHKHRHRESDIMQAIVLKYTY